MVNFKMPRSPREISSSKYYHIMIQGNNNLNLFMDDQDKRQLLKIIKGHLDWDSTKLIAYCIMDNYAHLLIREEKNISEIMKKINCSYAIYFNKKYKCTGHVFKDRFKSECIQGNNELLSVIRYIHNNPRRTGDVNKLPDYKWSSYCEYVEGKKDCLVDKNYILNQFGAEFQESLEKFIEYNNKENNDIYLDIQDCVYNKIYFMLNSYLKENNINLTELGYKENREHRMYLVIMLKENGNLSIRKIAEILHLTRGIVYRIISENYKDSN